MFEGLCQRFFALGVPVARGMLIWSTLHPLFQAEMVLWRQGSKAELDQFEPDRWRSIGRHRLEGVGHAQELFGFREVEAAAEAA
jgi:hypothetical protein